jgi:hypothetical protein
MSHSCAVVTTRDGDVRHIGRRRFAKLFVLGMKTPEVANGAVGGKKLARTLKVFALAFRNSDRRHTTVDERRSVVRNLVAWAARS